MDSLKVVVKTLEDEKEVRKEFTYEGNLNIPVTTLLERLNIEYDTKIHYSSSCLQGLCGSCAMLINGWPKLACKTFVNDEVMTKYSHKITIEPLSKFPVVKDLVIDRSVIFENMKRAQQWLEKDAIINRKNIPLEYNVSQCLMCGCCLEACANYNGEDEYYGVVLPVASSKISRQESDSEKIYSLKEQYNKHFFNGCVKSLVCEDVCPMEIPTQRAMSVMNHDSVWKFRRLLGKK